MSLLNELLTDGLLAITTALVLVGAVKWFIADYRKIDNSYDAIMARSKRIER